MDGVLQTNVGRRIAFNRTEGRGPGVLFLGGFRSDKEGTKALALEAWARAAGRAFVRFDYSGHGQSSGRFDDGAIGDWHLDAEAVLLELTDGPQILVGSSMGGWIALLLARQHPDRIAGLVTIAGAPDFTEDLMWETFSAADRERLQRDGRLELPSAYSREPDVITRRLIEDGRAHLVLRAPLKLPFPVRLLHGTADEDVPVSVALRLLDHAEGDDLRLTLVRGADHRFSDEDALRLIEASVRELSERVSGA